MKKIAAFGLLIVFLGIFMVVGCGGNPPPPKPATPQPAQPTQTSQPAQPAPMIVQPGSLILDGATNHTVVRGDTISKIAAARYGGSNMYYYALIWHANINVVPDPDVIKVRTNLIIPDLQRNLNNDGAKATIKADLLSFADEYSRRGIPATAERLRSLADSL
ncbi:MAG: LysM peptidoglycan-binding domain-containing protein [Treponema sp.]|nr:LysM peptidoglycan-binding domain-containing protein [Treponema sp.]